MLLGRPAIGRARRPISRQVGPALRAGAPAPDDRRPLPQRSRWRASACAACATGSSGSSGGRPARRHLAAHAPPLVRQPSARGRRRPARRPGAARPRQPGHDPGLHACLADATAHRLPSRTPAGGPLESTPRVSGTARTLARAGIVVTRRSSSSRLLGWVRSWSSADLRRLARPRRLLRRVPHAGPRLPAGRRGRPQLGADPGPGRASSPTRRSTSWRVVVDGRQHDARRAGRALGVMAVFAPLIVPVITPGFDACPPS